MFTMNISASQSHRLHCPPDVVAAWLLKHLPESRRGQRDEMDVHSICRRVRLFAVQLHDICHAKRPQELPALLIRLPAAVEARRHLRKIRNAVHHRTCRASSQKPTAANHNRHADQFSEVLSHSSYAVWEGVISIFDRVPARVTPSAQSSVLRPCE